MVNIYLSGRFSLTAKKEAAWLKRTGCKYRCFSFAVVDPEGINYSEEVSKALTVCEKRKVSIMMDSGAFSLHMLTNASKKRGASAKAKQSFNVEELQKDMYKRYVKYCLANKEKWEFYVTLDFKRSQPVIYKMQQQFLRDRLAPMPVFHGDSPLDWLHKHMDMGHKYIAIGGGSLHKGSLHYYLDKVFDFGAKHNLEFHGLALTSMKLITQFPWRSVDSSTWSRCAAFGHIIIPDFKHLCFYNVHVSERESKGSKAGYNQMSAINKDKLRAMLKDHGFDVDAMRDGVKGEEERHDWNGYMYSNLDKFGMDWEWMASRKVEWESLI
jgi:hypothetical protein